MNSYEQEVSAMASNTIVNTKWKKEVIRSMRLLKGICLVLLKPE